MTRFTGIIKTTEKLAIDNSPALLTAVGVVGTISTAVLAARGALRYDEASKFAEEEQFGATGKWQGLEPRTRAMLMAHHFGPSVIVGSLTISAIIGANRIGTRRAAAMAAAYTVVQEGFDEYKHKVRSKIGDKKELAIRDEIAAERVARNPSSESNVVLVGNGDVLCYDLMTDRYFNSSKAAIDAAVNEVNHMINTHGYASVSDFYDQINIPHTSVSDELGWSGDKLLVVNFSYVGSEDGRPCVAIDFQTEPVRSYHRFH